MKKGMCELCSKKARLHCESDQARLCFECDEKVHGANFLVAKHCRSLLCHVCQASTPWKASAPKLFPTITVCENCSENKNSRIQEDQEINQPQIRNQETQEIKNGVFDETQSEDDDDGNQGFSSSDDDDDDDDDEYESEDSEDVEDDDEEEEDDDDGENQVVPWSSPPPMASPSSCSEEEAAPDGGAEAVSSTSKRIRSTDYLDSVGEERSLSQNCGMSSISSLRPWKLARNGDSR